ncbi:tRNA-specific adenosine deaminase [Granulibacter bethesdensis]|uniref:tRNA-specific adenosine deaminase n=2 Tax=Granulibacter bethesdensis TaxID=364410 RepID=A0AAN0RCE2_9PROT|nr:tRNA-specific adenosine deaminase [Granulibacter bethesdensis]AHJ64853.1 tRNA-specific adenosine deaminase [Granulibacter bethesdensis CGDNIH4]
MAADETRYTRHIRHNALSMQENCPPFLFRPGPGEAMERALKQARLAAAAAEVPVGAVVISPEGYLLAQAHNLTETNHDASAHAEMLAMREAAKQLGSTRLIGCDLYVTLEPCPMCAQAASHFRIRRIIFGAYDPKGGGIEHGARVLNASSCHHQPEIIGGVRETEAVALLRSFFQARR